MTHNSSGLNSTHLFSPHVTGGPRLAVDVLWVLGRAPCVISFSSQEKGTALLRNIPVLTAKNWRLNPNHPSHLKHQLEQVAHLLIFHCSVKITLLSENYCVREVYATRGRRRVIYHNHQLCFGVYILSDFSIYKGTYTHTHTHIYFQKMKSLML